MAKKKSEIRVASVYFELSFPYKFTKKGYQTIAGMLSNMADKIDILKKREHGVSSIGLMIHGIYYIDGMLDHEIDKIETMIQEPLLRIHRPAHIDKRKVFFV